MSLSSAEVVKDAKVVPEDVAKRLVCLSLSFSRFGVRRKVDPNTVIRRPEEALAADVSKAVHVGKDILQSESLGDVGKMAGDARGYAVSQAVPAKFLRGGMYLVPSTLLEAIETKLRAFSEKFDTLVGVFLEEYESGRIVENARARLEPIGLFNPKDYPASAAVRASFKMRWRWFEFAVPEKLRETNPALWEAERKKATEMWAEAATEIRIGLREGVAEIVRRLIERLEEPGEEGRKRVLRESTLDALDEFVQSFPFKNVTGDAQLQAEIDKLKAIRKGIDVSDLKKYGGLRTSVRGKLTVAATALAKLVEEAPERLISFDDEAA